jgi:hypothetical protein
MEQLLYALIETTAPLALIEASGDELRCANYRAIKRPS